MIKPVRHFKPFDFSIFRIVGGDLTPRDKPRARLEMIKFILENEKEFPGVLKGWVLNAVTDMDYRREMEALLHQHKAYFVVMPMNRVLYDQARTRDEKIIQAIPINRARNHAVRFGQCLSQFTVVLDGDCFFDETTWGGIADFIRNDQRKNQVQHYGIPHTRSYTHHVLRSSLPSGPLAEPMPVFRNDSPLRFEESWPFGKGDKLRLLFKMGYSEQPGQHHTLVNDKNCRTVGYVHHLATGDEVFETDLKERIRVRNQAVDELLHRLDTFVRPVKKPNTFSDSVQGWFDFSGLYSHLAFHAPQNATIVEVGSWLGKSVCYLAREAKNYDKAVAIYAVDTWRGTPGDAAHQSLINQAGGPNALFEAFKTNIRAGGVDDIITPLRMSSVEASARFENESLDMVFIDASHQYADVMDDLRAWYPKVKPGGIIAGHDYAPGHSESDVGVVRAVNEFFAYKGIEARTAGRTWLHRKG